MNHANDKPDHPAGVPNDPAAERELLRRLADGRGTSEEFAQVEQRLLHDREFRSRYVRFMDLEASLYDELVSPVALAPLPGAESTRTARRGRARLVGWILMASALVALIAFAATYLWRADQAGTGYEEIALQGLEAVAIVTHAEGLGKQRAGGELRTGMRLKPGSLTLEQGQVQVEFLGGAKVLVQGPCELHILSPKSATLVSGKAATRVLAWGHGFVLNTPDTALVDLGTEFAVAVDDRSGSEVRVVDGEVEVSLLGEDGSTLTSERITEHSSLRVAPGGTALESSDGSLATGLTLFDRPTIPLAVPPAYTAAVLGSRPTLYWRFERLIADVVPNEVGPELAARLFGHEMDARAIRVQNGGLQFAESSAPRYLTAAEPIAGLNGQSFSLEFWANPDMLHWATLAGIVPETDTQSLQHLNVLELAHQTTLVHQAGAFRFMHRHPPEKKGGVNVFTKDGCTPGHWHHLVAVKTPEALRFYLNGRVSRKLDGAMGSDEGRYQLFMGQLRTSSSERQFVGAIDEVALYLHALDDAVVQSHYDAMFSNGGVHQPGKQK